MSNLQINANIITVEALEILCANAEFDFSCDTDTLAKALVSNFNDTVHMNVENQVITGGSQIADDGFAPTYTEVLTVPAEAILLEDKAVLTLEYDAHDSAEIMILNVSEIEV